VADPGFLKGGADCRAAEGVQQRGAHFDQE